MLLCTLVSSLGAVLGCVPVSLHFGDLSFSAAAIFFFPTILMEKFEQSREHQSPKWLIAFADYSAQANMEFFCPKSYFSLGRENLIFLPAQVILSALTVLCGTGLFLMPRPSHGSQWGLQTPQGLEGSLILSVHLLLAVGVEGAGTDPSSHLLTLAGSCTTLVSTTNLI